MSHAAAISEMDARQFGDNLVRLEIVRNSLQAFANKIRGPARIAAEVNSLAVFFEDELPDLMRQNEVILTNAIRARRMGDHEVGAALDIMREDNERLVTLAVDVIQGLRSAMRSPDHSGRTALHEAISSYSAALRSHMDWAIKFVSDKGADSSSLP